MDYAVIYGSVRPARAGIGAARFVLKQLEARGHNVTLVDPLELNLPLMDKMYKEYKKGEAPQILEKLAETYRKADGFVIVSGEYNHSAPPALSNTLDFFLEEYKWRPSAIVCYSAGSFGGVRAAVHLRAMLCELGMPSTPSMFPIPAVQNAFTEDGIAKDEAYVGRAKRFFDELDWYAAALKEQRTKGVPY